MNNDSTIRDICQREIESRCYSHQIYGISVYNYLKRRIRNKELKRFDLDLHQSYPPIDYKEWLFSIIKSLFQLIILIIKREKHDNLIHSFSRVDSVNDVYLDKFTDPLIEYSNIGEDYFIFQKGIKGRHYKNRLHSENLIYIDAISALGFVYTSLFWRVFYARNKKTLTSLLTSINEAFPQIELSISSLSKSIAHSLFITICLNKLLKLMEVKRVFAPSRSDFLHLIPAAKMSNTKVYELQHGITYGETITYSGFQDPLFTPDKFLLFGDVSPKNVYGINEAKIFIIGWAFGKYVEDNVRNSKLEESSVLVISEPHITDRLLSVIATLANDNPNIVFYFRPHPLEILSTKQKNMIDNRTNIRMDDNKQNLLSTLTRFKYVIGENSTALYEALSLRKEVGKINMGGLHPKYLQKEDENYFYEITDNLSFVDFINRTFSNKHSKNIYSTFKPEVINNLLIG